MNPKLSPVPYLSLKTKMSATNRRAYQLAIWVVAWAGGNAAIAQTNAPAAGPPAPITGGSTNVTQLEEVNVIGHLDVARNQIVPDLGASTYTVSKDQISAEAQGANAPFNQVLLRTPGVAQDSLGQLHLRGEHANLQYRINDVLLPEGITGFGQELDTRFVDRMRLITGSLPAQYGFRTAGIVDLQTKSGAFDKGGSVSMYGGSYDTLQPSFEYGGSQGKLNYFIDGSYNHNGIGIENPTASARPIHDDTDQYKTFSYLSYLLDDTSRISVMLSASYSNFEIPDTPGLPAGTAPGGNAWLPGMFDSTTLNERQREQNYYGVVAYQKSVGDLNVQVAAFGRNSSVYFMPDSLGDLYFNGVASDVNRNLYSGGMQGDFSLALSDAHTLRGGVMFLDEAVMADTSTTVFNLDAAGNPFGAPYGIGDNNATHGQFYGLYLQDEWKLSTKLTLNFGGRFDAFSSFVKEDQVSPRFNAIYQATEGTTLHAGYARYFTPPPLELVRSGTLSKFNGTSNASAVGQNDPVEAERAHYFDAGITQKLAPGLQVGLDAYYKMAHNQLDDGFFGQTLILSPFNYRVGMVEGVEFTATYNKGGFTTFANIAVSDALGKGINSAQFLFDSGTLSYIQNEYVHLDHDQRITGSFGVSYLWKQTRSSTRVYADALYGSGLRTDLTLADGSTVLNGASVGPYYSVNLGVEQALQLCSKRALKGRVDLVNVTDNSYQLRDGAGIGVNAAQFGMRFGLFGSLTFSF
jgi:outer membrane receptor protein involved in Fe transport